MKRITILLFLISSAFALQAQERQDSIKTAVFVARNQGSISRLKEMRTEIISSEGLKKMACCNLAESFENSASVTVGYSDATTGARQIRLLGLSGVYTQMLDENRPVMRGLSAPFGLNYVPGSWLESIQIAKGSPSVINGAESITGQINIEYRKPTDERKLFVNGSVMSDSKADLNIFSASALSSTIYSNVFAHIDGNFTTMDMDGDGFMDNPRQLQFSLANRWLYYTPELQVRWGVSAVQDKRNGGQEGYDRNNYSLTASDKWGSDITNRSLNGYLKAGKPLREDGSASIAMVADYNIQSMNGYWGATEYIGRQHSGFLNLLYRNQLNEIHDFTVGISGNIDALAQDLSRKTLASASTQTMGDASKQNFLIGGVYGEYTLHLNGKFTAITGVRLNHYDYAGFKIVPRATFKYTPVRALVFRANAGRGLRYSLPLVDNIGVFSTGKAFAGDFDSGLLEDSWTYGGNATLYMPIGVDPEGAFVSFDYFSSRFSEQMIADYESIPGAIEFYALDGLSYTDNYQVDFNVEPFTRFTIALTARYTDARVTLKNKGLAERPMLGRFKGVLNIQYKTRLSKWQFDFTASMNGSARVYDFMKSQPEYYSGRTQVYPLLYAQITRRFRGLEIYLGGENLTGFRQKDAILSNSDPSSANFDASAIWGPLMGARIYAGFRYTLWNKR